MNYPKRYKLVTADTIVIDKHVSDLLEEGWELYGQPFLTGMTNGVWGPVVAQPMILRVDNPDFVSGPPGWAEPCKEADND
ncbi:DUF1737 domain-containing protein [Candidatus Pacearchaeota archaeon]|jgi:hypothetical protein|nr:DUF1737 domain-containing protein [Candidatus Pacearchaeota archaeon]